MLHAPKEINPVIYHISYSMVNTNDKSPIYYCLKLSEKNTMLKT